LYQFLTPKSVVETFKTSRQYTEGLTEKFQEYERLALNKPHPSIPKEYPKVTDGTTASIIRKTPHRIIQQLPVGRVESDTEDWLSTIASFVYTNKIIPYANEDYGLLQKCWNVVERFLTFGYCGTYAPFVNHSGYFCTDLRLIYWGDIFLQPGKLSDVDSNYIFMRSWWQTKDIEALIDAQSKLKSPTWDIKALNIVKDLSSTKDNKSLTPSERAASSHPQNGIELITGFQRGVGAKFYTFHVNSGQIVRTKENKDPRGELPISFAYGDIDGSNPFGRSVIELVGGLQNLMDAEMQMYQYNRALQLNPPLIKRGAWSKNKIKFAPNVIIDMGSGDPNTNSLESLKIDTSALQNFPANYGMMKSQMLNLLASPDTSISSDIGNPGFSKTPQGVLASQANLSVDDNYVRKQFEKWFERWSETAINIYFAEREGVEELQLDDDTAEELRQLAVSGKFDPSLLSDDNKVRIDFSSATPALKFRVSADSSKQANDPAQVGIATSLLETTMKFPMLNKNFGGRIDVDELAEKIVRASGIADPERVAPEPTPQQKQAKIQSSAQPNAFSPMYDKPQIRIDYKDVEDAGARAELLKLAGAPPTGELPPVAPGIAEQAARQSGTATDPGQAQAQQASDQAKQQTDQANLALKAQDQSLKAQDQAHKQQMDQAKLVLDAHKQTHDQAVAEAAHQVALKQANKPVPKPAAKAKGK
jgi:hypothetical protein